MRDALLSFRAAMRDSNESFIHFQWRKASEPGAERPRRGASRRHLGAPERGRLFIFLLPLPLVFECSRQLFAAGPRDDGHDAR